MPVSQGKAVISELGGEGWHGVESTSVTMAPLSLVPYIGPIKPAL